jgi:hypothetical protein
MAAPDGKQDNLSYRSYMVIDSRLRSVLHRRDATFGAQEVLNLVPQSLSCPSKRQREIVVHDLRALGRELCITVPYVWYGYFGRVANP